MGSSPEQENGVIALEYEVIPSDTNIDTVQNEGGQYEEAEGSAHAASGLLAMSL